MFSQKLFDQSFFNRMAHFSLSPRIRPVSGLSGHYKSGKKGASVEFSDVREYLPGDDIRRIDWNAYARTEKLFIKLFMDEREAHYHILLDMSLSMNIPKTKSIHACRIAGMLAWLALNSGDRVDITFLRKETSYTTKSCAGTSSFYRLLKELENAEFSGSCNLVSAIRPLSFHGSGTTFLISDFLGQSGEVSSAKESKHMLTLLANQKQSTVLIQIASREEESPERLFSEEVNESLFTLTDSETNEKIKVTPSRDLLKRYLSAKTSLEQQLASTSSRCQALYIKTISDEPLEKFLECGLQKGLWK